MKNQKKARYLIRTNLKFYCVFLIFFLLVCQINAVWAEENKITISERDNQQDFSFNMQLNPISIDVLDEIYQIDHIEEIVPIITQSFGLKNENMPPFNFSEVPFNNGEFNENPPSLNDLNNNAPPQWNGSRPNGDFNGRNQDIIDYVVEAVSIKSIDSFQYYDLPNNVIEGRMLDTNDSEVVYIGQDAQEYFDTYLGGTIEINNHSFLVIGIFRDENYSNFVYMDLHDGQTIFGLADDEINTIYVYVDDVTNLEDVATSIQNLSSDYMIRYMGNMDFNRFPGDNFKFPSNAPIPDFTPGFEIIVIFCAIGLFIFFKKAINGGINY